MFLQHWVFFFILKRRQELCRIFFQTETTKENDQELLLHSLQLCTTSSQKAPQRKQHNRKEKQQATHHDTEFSTWNILFLVKWKILQVTYVQWIDKLLALLNCRKRLMSTCQYSCWMPIDQAYYFAAFELRSKLRFYLDIKYSFIVLPSESKIPS